MPFIYQRIYGPVLQVTVICFCLSRCSCFGMHEKAVNQFSKHMEIQNRKLEQKSCIENLGPRWALYYLTKIRPSSSSCLFCFAQLIVHRVLKHFYMKPFLTREPSVVVFFLKGSLVMTSHFTNEPQKNLLPTSIQVYILMPLPA